MNIVKETLSTALIVAVIFGVNAAAICGLYYFGTWLFTFGRTFGIVSVSAMIVVLTLVVVRLGLDSRR